jgi:cellulose synthase (UDP-forming)
MFVLKEVTLRLFSGNSVSHKWIGIYETSIMPYLVITFVKERLGMATGGSEIYDKHKKSMIPFLVLIVLSLAGITSSLLHLKSLESIGIVILMFWLVRNLYFLIMSIFLVDGRDGDYEEVRVKDAEPLILKDTETGSLISEGITTYLTEHSLGTFLDDNPKLPIGKHVDITIETMNTKADLECIITGFQPSRSGSSCVYRMEILDYKMDRYEYLQILYDRIPTLPQTLSKDYGVISHLLRNIAHRILR